MKPGEPLPERMQIKKADSEQVKSLKRELAEVTQYWQEAREKQKAIADQLTGTEEDVQEMVRTLRIQKSDLLTRVWQINEWLLLLGYTEPTEGEQRR